jgi:hypothetical protein
VSAIALLDLGTRELHRPSATHGVAVCGATMPDSGWAAGPLDHLIHKAQYYCPVCYEVVNGPVL